MRFMKKRSWSSRQQEASHNFEEEEDDDAHIFDCGQAFGDFMELLEHVHNRNCLALPDAIAEVSEVNESEQQQESVQEVDTTDSDDSV